MDTKTETNDNHENSEFERLVATVANCAREFATNHENVDSMMLAQALIKTGLQQILYHTQHPSQRMILQGILDEVSQCLEYVDQVEAMNMGTSSQVN